MAKIDKKILGKTIRTTFTNQIMFGIALIYFSANFDIFGIYLISCGYPIAMFFAYQRESNKF